jgi:hypothetical protein
MIDDECGVFGGMRTGRGNRSTLRKPAPVSLCPPQIPHDLTWAWAAAVISRWQSTWVLARPVVAVKLYLYSVGLRFESQEGYWLFCLKLFEIIVSPPPPCRFRDNTSIRSPALPSSYCPIHHSKLKSVADDSLIKLHTKTLSLLHFSTFLHSDPVPMSS